MPFGFGRGRGRRIGWGGGRNFRGGRGAGNFGPGAFPDNCICPNCGVVIPHRPGLPCFQTKCPQCNSRMTRQFSPENEA